MEAFSSLISKVEEKGFIRGFRVIGRNGEGASVSHLLFADDTHFFCGDNRNQLVFGSGLLFVLKWFQA